MWIMTNNSYLSIVSKDCGPAARGELTRRGCFTGSGISLPSLRRRRPGWARFAFKHQLVWTFAIALDLAVDLGLDLGKFFFDFDFTLGGDRHCRQSGRGSRRAHELGLAQGRARLHGRSEGAFMAQSRRQRVGDDQTIDTLLCLGDYQSLLTPWNVFEFY